MGTLAIYQGWGLVWVGLISSYSISLSLNVLLTLMIAIRLILHSRTILPAPGSRIGISGLYKVIATMLVESCALYAVASLLAIIPLALDNVVSILFLPILFEIQVRAFPPFFDQLSDVAANWAGYCSAAHRSTSCKPERAHEHEYCHGEYLFALR